jgi:hypothetical protein
MRATSLLKAFTTLSVPSIQSLVPKFPAPPFIYHEKYSIPWPENHRFPMNKFKYLKDTMVNSGIYKGPFENPPHPLEIPDGMLMLMLLMIMIMIMMIIDTITIGLSIAVETITRTCILISRFFIIIKCYHCYHCSGMLPIYAVHDRSYVDRFCEGLLSKDEIRRIGLDFSGDLVYRTLAEVGGTIHTTDLALGV